MLDFVYLVIIYSLTYINVWLKYIILKYIEIPHEQILCNHRRICLTFNVKNEWN